MNNIFSEAVPCNKINSFSSTLAQPLCPQREHQLYSIQSSEIVLSLYKHNSSLTDLSAGLSLSGELLSEWMESLVPFVFDTISIYHIAHLVINRHGTNCTISKEYACL